MPISKANRARYPKNWTSEIVPRILARAGYRCETCRIPHHAVGYRDADGRFCSNAGNLYCDATGEGKHPDGTRLTYAEAREFVDEYNCCGEGRRRCDDDGRHWLVVVLTVAHLTDELENCADDALAALCQRCHNRRDAPSRARNAAATRRARRIQQQPALALEAA